MTASTPKHAGFGPLLSHPTHKPTNRPNSLPRSGCALRGWAEGPARKPGDSQNRDTRSPPTAVTPAAVRRQRRVQRAPSSCSPPPGMASDCATLRSQEHGQFVFGRSQRRTNTEHERSISALRIRGLRADRYHGASATRFQPKALPRVRLTAAPLALRRICRRPRGFHLDFAHRKTSEIPLQAGGRRTSFEPNGTTVGSAQIFVPIFVARLGKSCQNVPTHFDDFPL